MVRTLIVAEAGVNHCGRLDTALALIAAAKTSGADAVKFQAFTPAMLAPGNWERQSMLKGLALTREELLILNAECGHVGIEFMCTPMDSDWLRFCVGALKIKRVKIGSAQAGDAAFVRAVAAYKLPVIISNGMADNAEFCRAVGILVDGGCDVTPMACISAYPTPDARVRMSEVARLKDLFPGMTVGFSSHCRSFWPSVAAVYAGAVVTENHLMLPGCTSPDAGSSLLPVEFTALVREIRTAEVGR